jgi:hypothetical protein
MLRPEERRHCYTTIRPINDDSSPLNPTMLKVPVGVTGKSKCIERKSQALLPTSSTLVITN